MRTRGTTPKTKQPSPSEGLTSNEIASDLTPAVSPASEGSPNESFYSFEEICAALKEGIRQGLGNFRQAQTLLQSAEKADREVRQFQAQQSAIKAAGGPRSGVRLSYLSRTIKSTLARRDGFLRGAEAALDLPK